MSIPNPYQQVSFAIKKSDIRHFNKCIELFQKYICAQKDVPYPLIGKFYNLISDIESIKSDDVYSKALPVINKAVDYFSTCDKGNYNFQVVNPKEIIPYISDFQEIEEIKTKPKYYYLRDLFKICAIRFYQLDRDNNLTQKDVVRFFYKEIETYKNVVYNRNHKSKCKHYKTTVMAAYLTKLTGYEICNQKGFKNEDLFQSSKNYVKDFQKTKAAK